MFSCPICWEKHCNCTTVAAPQVRGLAHFESLITQLTGCRTGDGTLQVTDDRKAYVNPHVQWLWERYQARSK